MALGVGGFSRGGGGGRGMLILFASLPVKRSSFRAILKVVGLLYNVKVPALFQTFRRVSSGNL